MKGKILNFKTVLAILLLVTAGFVFAILPIAKSGKTASETFALEKVTLGQDGNKQEFSALADGDVILSVEKVMVNSTETEYKKDGKTIGYPNGISETNNVKTFLGGYDNFISSTYDYTFFDLPDGEKDKTVVEYGKFVRFDNEYESDKYVMKDNESYQEAVIISFGAYVQLDDKSVVTAINDNPLTTNADETICAKITALSVEMFKNGVKQTNIPNVRNIGTAGTGLYFDFVHMITQEEDNSNEGFYKLNFKYMVGGYEHTSSFEFYVLNNSTYTQSENQSLGYNAKPTLGWIDNKDNSQFAKTDKTDGYVRYMIGNNGISDDSMAFPTITYDYTKYKLTYAHVANQNKTSYDLSVEYLASGEASLIMSKESSSGKSSTPYNLADYYKENLNNLVTIMLTEPGTYEFNYEYLYRGYNANVAPVLDWEKETLYLSIHGLSAKYSKTGFESANLQYFEIATKESNSVDLIIPNGYELDSNIDEFKNKKLGFSYTLVKSDKVDTSVREGDIFTEKSLNSLANKELKDNKITTDTSYYDYLKNNIATIKEFGKADSDDKTNIKTILNSINYIETNQGSLWIEGNDKYTAINKNSDDVENSSFYFYSPTRIDEKSLISNEKDNNGTPDNPEDDWFKSAKVDFTNVTSFNKKGYYLVFIHVIPNGMSGGEFWQVFAFQYTSSSVNIEIKAVDNKGTDDDSDDARTDVPGGKYTNKPVEISWLKPGLFDRSISGYYYFSKDEVKDKDKLLETKKNEFTNITESVVEGKTYCVVKLGDYNEVPNNSFVKYLIRLESEGDSATHKMFTIDRQAIAGVQPYLIKENNSLNSVYYSFATKDNSIVPIQNSITDSYATFLWDDKDSGAEIKATYSYTPFVLVTKSKDNAFYMTGNNAEWMHTNYVLGNTISGSELIRPESTSLVSGESILFNQGIYLINLKDSAGNETVYAFVIDRTNGLFRIGEGKDAEFLSNTTVVSGSSIEYTVGEYKVFELLIDDQTNDDLKELILSASTGNYDNFEKYYSDPDTSNKSSLAKLFQKFGDKYYFTVENTKVVAYDGEYVDGTVPTGVTGELIYNGADNRSYYRRVLYMESVNSLYSTKTINNTYNSYINAIINKDNARGAVYYSTSKIDINNVPEFGKDSENMKLLDAGTGEIAENGISGARATSAKHVGFTWLVGSGDFEVTEVYYKIYSLNQNAWDEDQSSDNVYFYYSNDDEPTYVYQNGPKSGAEISDGRGLISFNGENMSKAGLYVITRVYKNSNEDKGEDVGIKNYYFIVDRNGIIQDDIGGSIKIELMEGEAELSGSDFSLQGARKKPLNDSSSGIKDEEYYTCLSTTKLPATFNVPLGKYLSEKGSSDKYEAGQLNIKVYFVNTQEQIKGKNKDDIIKIYDSTDMINHMIENGYSRENALSEIVKAGTYIIDIYEYLTITEQSNLRDVLTESTSKTNVDRREWLFLPGDYVVRISDNVVDFEGKKHVQHIGFEITSNKDNGPRVDNFSGSTKFDENMIKLNSLSTSEEATVSQEFLKVVLPTYDKNIETKAQVDPEYIVIKQYYGSGVKDYLVHEYIANGGISLKEESKEEPKMITIDDDGKINIWLDTKLRVDPKDPNSAIDYANLTKPLSYEITIRYKLNNPNGADVEKWTKDDYERYMNCYIYYDGNFNVNQIYETTYTITIDREAPSTNITNLNTADTLVEEYRLSQGVDSMFEDREYQTGSQLYFTKRYAKYYQGNRENKGDIYVYQVKGDTTFDWTDVDKVLVHKIGEYNALADYNLSLPVVDITPYVVGKQGETTLSALGVFDEPNRYYEVVEMDKAGNATQYVVHYEPEKAEIKMPFRATLTINEVDDANLTLETNKALNVFKLQPNGDVTRNENFYKIEIFKANTPIFRTLTNATTDYNDLLATILKTIEDEKFGQFTVKVTTRTATSTMNINLYNEEDVIPLDIEKMIVKQDGSYKIDLYGANVYDEENQIWYFATKIKIKTGAIERIFEATYNNLNSIEYKEDGNNVKNPIDCTSNTTYYIEIVDVLGNVKKYRFNTSGAPFIVLEFVDVNNDPEEDYFRGSVGSDFIYYGFTSATLKFDNTIYSSEIYEKKNGEFSDDTKIKTKQDEQNKIYDVIEIPAPKNGLIEIKVELIYNGEIETTYYITIDTRISNVVLRDYNTAETRDIINTFDNKNYHDTDVRANTVGTGIMNLQWDTIAENDYFDYQYRLYEKLKDDKGYRRFALVDGEYVESEDGEIGLNLNGKNNNVIATGEDSEGVYVFEIKVFGKDGTYLGNRLFAFEVQEINTQIYYVRNSQGVAIQPNSWFTIEEFGTSSKLEGFNQNMKMPLYISNHDLEVVITALDINKYTETVDYKDENGQKLYTMTVYVLSKENVYDIVFGLLKLDETSTLVDNVKISGEQDVVVDTSTNFTVSGSLSTNIEISGEVVRKANNLWLNKNTVFINAYYNDELISSTPFDKDNSYHILGNGQYNFTFTDLAGNVHEFVNDEDGLETTTVDKLDVFVLREVVTFINGEATVENAFYNNEVNLSLYASNKYVTGSIVVNSFRNGKPYTPKGYNPYVYSDYGNYRVEIFASYNSGTKIYDLKKVVTFTIINVNEARNSIDLTSLNGSVITKVMNSSGQDITNAFKMMLKQSSAIGGLNISYEDVIEYESNPANKDKLNVTSGKITFTLTYLVSDKCYPDREITLSFTLTNQTAKIPCTLEKGETTKKSFTIYFNPAILYEQVGDAYVYVNDEIVAYINENSVNDEVRIKYSFKANGDGDYYIKLVTSSGVILDSYKLTIKEPLNAGAIIIIIVVVAVVATVVTTIILLRRKMRIR